MNGKTIVNDAPERLRPQGLRARPAARAILRGLFAFAFALGASGGTFDACRAANVQIWPTHLSLTAHDHASIITLTNTDDAPLRVEVSAYRWTQGSDGQDALSPTDALIVFPELMTIPAKGQQTLRVATTDVATAQEGTYKISVTEIGSFSAPATSSAGLTVRLRANVPVFLAPTVDHQAGSIGPASVKQGTLDFDIFNTGTSHFVAKDVHITGLGSDTRAVFAQTFADSEVLAGSKRAYHLSFSHQQCSTLRGMTIQATAGNQHLVQTIDVPSNACHA